MPERDRTALLGWSVRLLRLIGAISVCIAIVAIVLVARGEPSGRGERMITLAVLLGAGALAGLALAYLPYAIRRKDRNDS